MAYEWQAESVSEVSLALLECGQEKDRKKTGKRKDEK